MTISRKIIWAAVLLPSAAAAAGASVVDELASCVAIAQDSARLECYDRLATELVETGAEGGAQADAAPAAPVATVQTAPQAVATATTAAAAPAVVEPSNEELFGMSPKVAAKTGVKEKRPVEAISAVVTKKVELREDQFNFYLDNGQVWQQKSASRSFKVEIGDTIQIRRSSFGGFRMVGQRERTARVKRVR